MLLQLQRPMKQWREEGMIQVERREKCNDMFILRIKDIKGMVHLDAIETDKVWLVNDRIDLTMSNELYVYSYIERILRGDKYL